MRIYFLIFAVFFASTAHAEKPFSNRSEEIFFIYQTMCVNTSGKYENAKPVISQLVEKKLIKEMSAEHKNSQPSFKKLSNVYGVRTEYKTGLFVGYDSRGVCNVYVQSAEMNEMREAFKRQVNINGAMLNKAAPEVTKVALRKVKDNEARANGTFFYHYELGVSVSSVAMAFAMSLAPEEKASFQQHFLTFNIGKKSN